MDKEPVAFQCVVCGECCRGGQKVWLTATDLQGLADHLGLAASGESALSHSSVLDTPAGTGTRVDYAAVLESRRIIIQEAGQHGVRRPRIRFKPSPAGLQCPFLINDLDETGRLWGKCSLHYTNAKPLVCRLAPLARCIDLDSGEEKWREVPPVQGCPGWPAEAAPGPEGRPLPVIEAEKRISKALREDLDAEAVYLLELRGKQA